MRWQIELVFKRLKTLFHYNEIPSKLDESAKAWFYGKLLLAALCETAVNKGRFSP
jgi:IS4 transposase